MGGSWLAAPIAAAGLALAATNADSVTLRTLGLSGNWAVECTKAPTSDNPHVMFATPADQYPEYLERGAAGGQIVAALSNVRALSGGQIGMTMTITNTFGGKTSRVTVDLVVQKAGTKFRFMEMKPDSGDAPVSGGIAKATGQPTQWIQKCGG